MKPMLLLFVVATVLFSACTRTPETFRYNVVVAGGPDGWPIWAEMISVDNAHVGGGYSGHGYDDIPPMGPSTTVRGDSPAPKSVEARWFSYRTQAFYEVAFALPEDMDARLADWYDTYPRPDYSHRLLLGFSGKGEAKAWWFVQCSACGFDRSRDFSVALVDEVKATEIPGDPGRYRDRTQEHIKEGTIPSSVLD